MSAPLPEFGEQVSEFEVMMVRFFYGLGVAICIYIIWATWKRVKDDVHRGGYKELVITILKLAIFAVIGYFAIQYGEQSGFFKEVSKAFHPGS